MAYESYVGVNGSMREIGGSEVGVDGATRQVALGYVGVNGEVRRVPGVAPVSYYLGLVQSYEAYDTTTGDLIRTTEEYYDDWIYINRADNGERIGEIIASDESDGISSLIYGATRFLWKVIIYGIMPFQSLQLPLDTMEERFGISYMASASMLILTSPTKASVYTLNGNLVISGEGGIGLFDLPLDGGGFILEVENLNASLGSSSSFDLWLNAIYESSHEQLNRADFILLFPSQL